MFNKLFKAEGGFTLVELLVTIAILGVLFGIVTLTLSGVGTDAEAKVKIAECAVVQSAIDIHMATTNTGSITERVIGLIAVIADADDVDFEAHLRSLPTRYTYWWTTTGALTCGPLP
jgi:prepilin-type N-terminal cleavage/methylation domain-containing protein